MIAEIGKRSDRIHYFDIGIWSWSDVTFDVPVIIFRHHFADW